MSTTKTYVNPRSQSMAKRYADLFKRIGDSRQYDAVVVERDSQFGNRYLVDIYASGFGGIKTHEAHPAINVSSGQDFEVGWPSKAIFDGDTVFLMPPVGMYALKVIAVEHDGKKHKIRGPIGNAETATTTVPDSLAIDWVYGWSMKNGYTFDSDDNAPDSGLTRAIGFMLARPTLVTENGGDTWLASGMAVTGGGTSSSPFKFGKIVTWTAGSNEVELDPCTDAGDDTGAPNVTAKIELPATKTHCSFFYDAIVDEPICYVEVGSLRFLISYPRPASTFKNAVFAIQATTGVGGFDSARVRV